MKHLFLDSHPLGLLSNPTPSPDGVAMTAWTGRILDARHRIYVPEIIDYELRRETGGRSSEMSGPEVVVVTTNASHLSQFVNAALWTNIEP